MQEKEPLGKVTLKRPRCRRERGLASEVLEGKRASSPKSVGVGVFGQRKK